MMKKLTAAKPPAPRNSLKTQRDLAKAGMSVSLGALVWTGFRRNRKAMAYHVLAGVALLAFTAWHMTLYKSNNKRFED